MKKLGKLLIVLFMLAVSVPVMAAGSGESFTESGTTLTLKASSGTDISDALRDTLEYAHEHASSARKYTVVVPAGTYTISNVLRIYSNITLKATGARIEYRSSEDHNMLISGDPVSNKSSACKGYGGFENITIDGGTWWCVTTNRASMIKIMHAKNVTLKNMTIEGGGSTHQVEVCAIDGFTVDHCTFKNFNGNPDNTAADKEEALQLDVPCAESVYGDTYQDGTMMKNVTLSNCTFQNVPRGFGTHTLLVGAYHENIKIINNKFIDVKEEAIVTSNYLNCEISGNTITNCGAGIYVQTDKTKDSSRYDKVEQGTYTKRSPSTMNMTIKNNTMTIVRDSKHKADVTMGIKLYGEKTSKRDDRVKGVTITGNKITTAGHGIHLSSTLNCTVASNTITGSGYAYKKTGALKDEDADRFGYDGVFVTLTSENASVKNNTIKNIYGSGIFLMGGAKAKEITGNKIYNCKYYGIGLYDKCAMTGAISKNTIQGTWSSALSLSTKCTARDVTGNIITKCDSAPGKIQNGDGDGNKTPGIINIFDSTVSGKISGNKITGAVNKYDGICVNKSTVKNTINGNTVTTASNGINVCMKSSVAAIEKNVLKSIAEDGILVNSAASKNITGNTISAKKVGIDICMKATAGAVEKNVVKSLSEDGILVNSAKSANITGNTISAKKVGVDVCMKATAGAIKSNTVTASGKDGILVNNSKSGAVSSNTIKKAGGHGIDICERATSGAVSGNKILSIPKGSIGIQIVNSSTISGAVSGNTVNIGRYGINICLGSKVTGAVSGNTLSGIVGDGILVNKATTKDITGNKITKPQGNGINICESSTTGEVSSNTVTNAKLDAILVKNKSTVGNIKGNVLTQPGKNGLDICGTRTKTGAISKNKIKKAANFGILLNGSKNTSGNIEKNTISVSGKYGLDICAGAGAGKITDNEISGAKKQGILLNKGTSKGITGNKLTEIKGDGIWITGSGSKVKGDIKGNKISCKNTKVKVSGGAAVTGSVQKK